MLAATGASRPFDANQAMRLARETFDIEAAALHALGQRVDHRFAQAVQTMLQLQGRVVVMGMGKSGHVGRKIAATLASTGTPALFVHPAEASHGDLGMVTAGDVCLLLSNSGETAELQDLLLYSRRFGVPLIGITRNPDSTLARLCDVTLLLPDAPEACAIGLAPTTSTTCALALGDALAVTLMRRRGFDADTFRTFHPGGKLGAQLLRIADLMHVGDKLPVVAPETPMGEVLIEMSAKGFGIAAVVAGGNLLGAISDGDLRRKLDGLMERTAIEVATAGPRVARPETLASEALKLMSDNKIGALFVVEDQALRGLVHIHDLLRAGVA